MVPIVNVVADSIFVPFPKSRSKQVNKIVDGRVGTVGGKIFNVCVDKQAKDISGTGIAIPEKRLSCCQKTWPPGFKAVV